MTRLRTIALLAAPLCTALPAAAQGILVAPHAVVLDHRTRSGALSLYNPGDAPAEVSLSTFFGYPVTDSAGGFDLRTVERPDPTMPSAAVQRKTLCGKTEKAVWTPGVPTEQAKCRACARSADKRNVEVVAASELA